MAVHLFGAKCSPSCATYCLRETAKQFGKNFNPKVAETILKSFYVDNCLTGADSEETAIDLIKSLRALLALRGFKLTKCLSSSDRVMSSVLEEEKSKAARSNLPSVAPQQRVFGISWNTATNEFLFTADLPNFPITKRGMLAVTNPLYDPLGFVAPVVFLARLLYSEICQKGFDWDEPITGIFSKRWLMWMKGLTPLREIKIPRCYKPKFDSSMQCQLHFFSDASNVARGVIGYLRMIFPALSIKCVFIVEKSHMNGPGRNTIPHLELEAALDAVKNHVSLKRNWNYKNANVSFGQIPQLYCIACMQTANASRCFHKIACRECTVTHENQ